MMTKNELQKETSSYRDNFGSVYYLDERVLRTVNSVAEKNYFFLKEKKIYFDSIKKGFLIEFKELDKKFIPEQLNKLNVVLETKKIPFISYPYEWTYNQLKDAALHHLNFQIFLLKNDCVLRDASAFNIQFFQGKPIFIDILSIKKYEEGEYWLGYKQFCENFLNPILLSHLKGIHHNQFFRGSMEGIDTISLNKILNFKNKLSLNILSHVVLQSKYLKQDIKNPKIMVDRKNKLKKLNKNSYLSLLIQLKSWINNIQFKKESSIWEKYEKENTYNEKNLEEKKKIVENFVKKIKPKKLIDIGCNNGSFSRIALNNGAKEVVGVDYDYNALIDAYEISKKNNINFLPLYINLVDPSPNQGWMQNERKGFADRFKCDAVIALAIEHHLIIGKNIPLSEFIKWILNFGNFGLLEFIPKNDQTVQKMFLTKEDIYRDYSEENFEKQLSNNADIINKFKLSDSNRIIYEYKSI